MISEVAKATQHTLDYGTASTVITLADADDFDGWRNAARDLIARDALPETIIWRVANDTGDLFTSPGTAISVGCSAQFTVPRSFLDLARHAILAVNPERFTLLYMLLHRLQRQPKLMEDHADPLVRRIEQLAKSVRRDIHKMRAFLRFREIDEESGSRFVAWFEPEHHVVRANAAFFVNRFASMRWSILTPELSIHWDGETLSESIGATKADAPGGDPVEAAWKTYYASIFNPSRVKIGAMLKEMPRKYWKNMPETALIPGLVASAQARESGMIVKARTMVGNSSQSAWEALREEALGCTRCPLYKHGTQTVFGEGPVDATMMFVGEQPGDQEDLAGRPFVGPAGQIFDRAMADAGLDRAKAYVTNAVKHFKFELRGKRRIHSKPNAGEISACRWWIEQEQLLIKPQVTVALGATAARSLFGKDVTISKVRGKAIDLPQGGVALVTVHPSFLLRMPDKERVREEYARFVEDLKAAGRLA